MTGPQIRKKGPKMAISDENYAILSPRRSRLSLKNRVLSSLVLTALMSTPSATTIAQTVPAESIVELANIAAVSSWGDIKGVDIAAPNAAGVSHNIYNQLKVGTAGLVLNNSRSDARSSIVGAVISANPNLNNGKSAKLIINEVNGQTFLGGKTEIVGEKAKVIFASPQGMECIGCSFINASRVTLAVASPRFSRNGNLASLDVVAAKGDLYGGLYILEEGLSAADVNQIDLVAPTTTIKGAIVAKDLVISSGLHSFGYGDRSTNDYNIWGSYFDKNALDSSELGGMYADKIKVVTVGYGVRTVLRGNIVAKAGNVEIEGGVVGYYPEITASGNIKLESSYTYLNENVRAGGNIFIGPGRKVLYDGSFITQDRGQIISGGSAEISTNSSMVNIPVLNLKSDGIRAKGDIILNLGGDLSISKASNLISGKAIKIYAYSMTQEEGSEIVAPQSFQFTSTDREWSKFMGDITSPKIYINSDPTYHGNYEFTGKLSSG